MHRPALPRSSDSAAAGLRRAPPRWSGDRPQLAEPLEPRRLLSTLAPAQFAEPIEARQLLSGPDPFGLPQLTSDDRWFGASQDTFVPASVRQGATVQVTLRLHNSGHAPASNVPVRLYAGPDTPAFFDTARPMGAATLFAISPLASATLTLRAAIPPEFGAGAFRIGYWIDPDNVVPEASEDLYSHLAVIPGTIVTTTIPADSFEPNQTFDSATNLGGILHARRQSGLTLHAPGDVDVYRFTPLRDGIISAVLDLAAGHSSVRLSLFTPDRIQPIDAQPVDGALILRAPASAGDVCYLRVTGAAGEVHPSYDLSLALEYDADSFEPNNSLAAPADLGPLSARALPGMSLHDDQDVDYFRFVPRAAGLFSTTAVFSDPTARPTLTLFDAGLASLRNVTALTSSASLSFPVAPQPYFLRVSGIPGAAASRYDLDLAVSYAADLLEPNNQFDAATDLGSDLPASRENLSIHTPGDVDRFRFIPTGEGILILNAAFDPAQGDLEIALLDDHLNPIAAAIPSPSGRQLACAVEHDRPYFLEIRAASGATQPRYDLDLRLSPGPDRLEPNNSFFAATRVPSPNRTEPGLSIHSPTDSDYFRFVAPTDGEFFATASFVNAAGNVDLILYNSFWQPIASAEGTADLETVRAPLLAGRTYYVRVYGAGGQISPRYDLSMGMVLAYDPYEPNNSFDAASEFGPVSRRNVDALSLYPDGDTDLYHFTAPASGHLTVTISTPAAVDLRLYDDQRRELAATWAGPGGKSLFHDLVAGRAYFLRALEPSGRAVPAYSLALSLLPLPDRFEPNDSFITATVFQPLTSRVEDALSLHAPSDQDFFRIEPLFSGRLTATLSFSNLLGNIDLELYDRNGALLARSATSDNAETVSVNATAAQIYYLRVLSLGGDTHPEYDLLLDVAPTPDRAEPNDDFASATDWGAVRAREEEDLTIHAPSNDDYFHFISPGNGALNLSMRFAGAQGDLDVILFSAAHAPLAASTGFGDTETLSYPVALGQDYYLRVFGKAGATALSYALSLNLSFPPDPREINDTFETATALGTIRSTAAVLSIHTPADQDFFRFTAAISGQMSLSARFDTDLGDLTLALYDDARNLLAASDVAPGPESILAAVAAGKSYFVRIAGQRGAIQPSYNFAIDIAPDAGRLTGFAWDDLNADGNASAAEPRAAGRTVFLDANNNGSLDPAERSASTDAQGGYRFENLPAGAYIVRIVLPAGRMQTTRQAAAPLVVAAGQAAAGPLFGLASTTLAGTSRNDGLYMTLSADARRVQIWLGDRPDYTVAPRWDIDVLLLSHLDINLGAGDDQAYLDLFRGNLIPPGSIRLDAGTGNDQLTVYGSESADHLVLQDDRLRIGPAELLYAGIDGVSILTEDGEDTLAISDVLPFQPDAIGFSGIDQLNLQRGTFAFPDDLALTADQISLSLENDASVLFASPQHLADLTLTGSSRVIVAPGGENILYARSLTLGPDARLDLADNAIAILADAYTRDAQVDHLSARIGSARAAGDWSGPGLTSSVMPALPPGTTLAIFLNDRGRGRPIRTEFGDMPLDANSLLVQIASLGDLDNSGTIDADDYFFIDRGRLRGAGRYPDGDLNYSGSIDADDYQILDALSAATAAARTATRSFPAARQTAAPQRKSAPANPAFPSSRPNDPLPLKRPLGFLPPRKRPVDL